MQVYSYNVRHRTSAARVHWAQLVRLPVLPRGHVQIICDRCTCQLYSRAARLARPELAYTFVCDHRDSLASYFANVLQYVLAVEH